MQIEHQRMDYFREQNTDTHHGADPLDASILYMWFGRSFHHYTIRFSVLDGR